MEYISDRTSVYLGHPLHKRLYQARKLGAQISVSALTRAVLIRALDEFDASRPVARSRR